MEDFDDDDEDDDDEEALMASHFAVADRRPAPGANRDGNDALRQTQIQVADIRENLTYLTHQVGGELIGIL